MLIIEYLWGPKDLGSDKPQPATSSHVTSGKFWSFIPTTSVLVEQERELLLILRDCGEDEMG